MRILIIGLGSIGRRHLSVLEKIEGLELAALRSRKGTLKEAGGINEFDQIIDALAFKPDGVVIANPTSLHIESSLPFLKAGCKLLIEKPISHSSAEAQKIAPFKDQVRVAYCLRFLPISKIVQTELKEESIFKISFKRSFYLPKWHPYADYRKEYTARKDLGGGVIRTLSHEIDLAVHWLGKPEKTIGVVDKLSPLDVDVDDIAFLSMKMNNGARVNMELDFYSPININQAELYTERGKYFWDAQSLSFIGYDDKEPRIIEKFEQVYDQIYNDQIMDFLNFVRGGESMNCTFEESVWVSDIIEEIEGTVKY